MPPIPPPPPIPQPSSGSSGQPSANSAGARAKHFSGEHEVEERNRLLSSIRAGKKLKKVDDTSDRSAPAIGKVTVYFPPPPPPVRNVMPPPPPDARWGSNTLPPPPPRSVPFDFDMTGTRRRPPPQKVGYRPPPPPPSSRNNQHPPPPLWNTCRPPPPPQRNNNFPPPPSRTNRGLPPRLQRNNHPPPPPPLQRNIPPPRSGPPPPPSSRIRPPPPPHRNNFFPPPPPLFKKSSLLQEKCDFPPAPKEEIGSLSDPMINYEEIQPVQNERNIEATSLSSLRLDSKLLAHCECSICCDTISDPRTLPCEHTFCKECIEETVQFNNNSIPFIRCPNCNTECPMSKGATVDSFKATLLLKQLLEEANNYSSDTEDRSTISLCCGKTVSSYCGHCDAYTCNDCVNKHVGYGCNSVADVKFSRAKGCMFPYCKDHMSLKYSACKSCAEVLCPYCKEKDHKNHVIISLVEYSSLFKGYITDKVRGCQEYADKMQSIVDNPCNTVEEVTKLITDRGIIILSKCMYVLEAMINLQTVSLADSQIQTGNILHDRQLWVDQLKACKELLSSNDHLKKGQVELIFNTETTLDRMPSTFPNIESLEEVATRIKVEDGPTDEDLFKEIFRLFGRLSVPVLDVNGNVSVRSVGAEENQITALLPELGTLDNADAASQYLEKNIERFFR